MRRLLCAVAGLLLAGEARAQDGDLDAAAERARYAWSMHDADALVAASPRVLIQLPGADPSAPVGRSQAAALLRDYLRRAEEVVVEVQHARQVGEDRGYVELHREYRVAGTQQVLSQTWLLSYQRDATGWVIVELRISG